MREYSIFHAPLLSFFSKKLYIDVGRNWKGVNFLYLLLLLTVCMIPAMINVHRGMSNFVNNEAPAIINQIPEITITDGRVSINETQPYYIIDPDTNKPLAIIDTTGRINSLKEIDALCLLTGNKVIMKKSNFENRTYDLSQVDSFAVNGEQISGWLQTGKKFLVVVIYPFALLGSYMYRIVQVLIYAAVGLLFASFCKTKLSYAALVRLAVVAVTPCIIVSTALGLAGTSLPGILYLVAALVYLFIAVKSNADITVLQDGQGQFTERREVVLDESSQITNPATEPERQHVTSILGS
ncbi:MAG: DUF1189 domain-containing protein [Planctomycetes bacterium]|nr:DUF1189 domain-containing protein [Planctomycetota bacterium]